GIYNFRMTVPVRRGLAYREIEEMPLVKPDAVAHPIFLGLTRGMATNRPGCLLPHPRTELQELWNFPTESLGNGRNLSEMRGGRFVGAPFIMGGQSQTGGRVLIIAGRGQFINGMMAQKDNDNILFGNNCLHWLTEGGKRKQVLFLVD